MWCCSHTRTHTSEEERFIHCQTEPGACDSERSYIYNPWWFVKIHLYIIMVSEHVFMCHNGEWRCIYTSEWWENIYLYIIIVMYLCIIIVMYLYIIIVMYLYIIIMSENVFIYHDGEWKCNICIKMVSEHAYLYIIMVTEFVFIHRDSKWKCTSNIMMVMYLPFMMASAYLFIYRNGEWTCIHISYWWVKMYVYIIMVGQHYLYVIMVREDVFIYNIDLIWVNMYSYIISI